MIPNVADFSDKIMRRLWVEAYAAPAGRESARVSRASGSKRSAQDAASALNVKAAPLMQ